MVIHSHKKVERMDQDSFINELCAFLERSTALSNKQAQGLKESFEGKSRLEFETFLIEEGLLSRQVLLEALSAMYKVPSFDAVGHFFDHRLVILFDKEFLKRVACIPLSIENGEILTVIAAVPNSQELAAAFNEYGSWDITFMVGLYQDIEDAIEEYHDDAVSSDLIGEMSDQEIYDAMIEGNQDLENTHNSDDQF